MPDIHKNISQKSGPVPDTIVPDTIVWPEKEICNILNIIIMLGPLQQIPSKQS